MILSSVTAPTNPPHERPGLGQSDRSRVGDLARVAPAGYEPATRTGLRETRLRLFLDGSPGYCPWFDSCSASRSARIRATFS